MAISISDQSNTSLRLDLRRFYDVFATSLYQLGGFRWQSMYFLICLLCDCWLDLQQEDQNILVYEFLEGCRSEVFLKLTFWLLLQFYLVTLFIFKMMDDCTPFLWTTFFFNSASVLLKFFNELSFKSCLSVA